MTLIRAALFLLLAAAQAQACVFCDALGARCCAAAASDSASGGAASDEQSLFARFRLQGGQQPQPGGDGTPLTVTYSYNNFLDGGLKDPDGVPLTPEFIRQATEEAFGLWAAYAPIHFVEVPDVGTPVFTGNTVAYNAYNTCETPDEAGCDFGTIRMNHRFINGSDAQNGGPTTKALAWFPSNSPNLGSDIHFDNGDPWAVVGTPSEPDILGIMAHEIGHTLGIGHSTIAGAVMFPAALRRSGPGTGILTPDDIAAVQAIYGQGVGSVTPLLALVPEPMSILVLLFGLGCLPAGRVAR